MRTWPAVEVARSAPEDDLPDLFQAALTDFVIVAIDESLPTEWRIFFHTHDERDRAMQALQAQFSSFAMKPIDMPDENWAARSQASLKAIRVGSVTVAPPWDIPKPDSIPRLSPRVTVVIQPSMGFGTGHHATTRLCLAMMQHFQIRGINALDVGTGSGVLAIAASLLGARFVVGIDNDPDAMQSARENLALNPTAKVDLRIVDLRSVVLLRFDLVVANLTGALLIQTARQLLDLIAAKGPLILSGFTKAEEPAVLAAFPRMRVVDRNEEDEWVCITLQREGTFE
jgi:ribosomal protein L11 methyltransferase